MALQDYNFHCFFIMINFLCSSLLCFSAENVPSSNVSTPFKRSSFPSDFAFGASSSAYQYEGAAKDDGKGPSIWDTFAKKFSGKILDGSNGNLANDFYHRYKEDVKLMEFIGLNAFRFSISWARILPHGKLSKGLNIEGITFYNNLINELLSKGIQPFATIYHWDLPQALQDEYGGFLSPRVVDDFKDFADVCFKEFGDRVKHWVTMNEPYIFIVNGYDSGALAPGRCSSWMNNDCPFGNSATALHCYSRLAPLSCPNSQIIQGKIQAERDGKFIGDPTDVSIFYVYPRGLKDLLVYTKKKYKNPTIYITECGIGDANINSIKQGTNDPKRINFYRRHLLAVKQAITDGVDVKGFFPWSFLDNFEWGSGYTQKFGLVYVDRSDGLKRYLKNSALWFKKFLQ